MSIPCWLSDSLPGDLLDNRPIPKKQTRSPEKGVSEPLCKLRDFKMFRGRVLKTHSPRHRAVANEALVMRLWPGNDPLHRKVRLANGDSLQVIGIVKTGKYAFLTEEPRPYL